MRRTGTLYALCALTALVLTAAADPARALSFGDVLLDGTFGSGANEAIIVIDWDSGITPTHAWLFRWDGFASYATAYAAIEAGSGGAFDWAEGNFVEFMNYDDGSELHATSNAFFLSFWSSADGESWLVNGEGVEDTLLVNGGWAGANADIVPTESWPGDAPSVPQVPEPASGLLVALGLTGLAAYRRR